MEGLFTVQNLAIIAVLAAVLFWCCCRVGAQSDVIIAAKWAAQFGKAPPEGEDV